MSALRHAQRTLLACGVLLSLAGCTDASRSSVDAIRLLARGQAKVKPTAQDVAAKPYYQLHAITANGDAVLILGNVDGQRELWYGRDGAVVALQNGRVTQTIGLPQNLDGSRMPAASDPFVIGLQKLEAPLTYQREDDWSPGYRYGIAVTATLRPSGMTDIDILGTSHHVMLVTEELKTSAGGFHASNRYWVDPADGFVWKSEQSVMPGLTFKLEQLRPYRGARQG